MIQSILIDRKELRDDFVELTPLNQIIGLRIRGTADIVKRISKNMTEERKGKGRV